MSQRADRWFVMLTFLVTHLIVYMRPSGHHHHHTKPSVFAQQIGTSLMMLMKVFGICVLHHGVVQTDVDGFPIICVPAPSASTTQLHMLRTSGGCLRAHIRSTYIYIFVYIYIATCCIVVDRIPRILCWRISMPHQRPLDVHKLRDNLKFHQRQTIFRCYFKAIIGMSTKGL